MQQRLVPHFQAFKLENRMYMSTCVQALQEQGCLSFRSITAAGPTGVRRMAQLPPDVDAGRITYIRVLHQMLLAITWEAQPCMYLWPWVCFYRCMFQRCIANFELGRLTPQVARLSWQHLISPTFSELPCICSDQAEPEAFAAEVDGGAADAVVLAGLLTRLQRPAALLASLRHLLRPQVRLRRFAIAIKRVCC